MGLPFWTMVRFWGAMRREESDAPVVSILPMAAREIVPLGKVILVGGMKAANSRWMAGRSIVDCFTSNLGTAKGARAISPAALMSIEGFSGRAVLRLMAASRIDLRTVFSSKISLPLAVAESQS